MKTSDLKSDRVGEPDHSGDVFKPVTVTASPITYTNSMILAATESPHLADGRLAAWLFSTPQGAERFQAMVAGELDPAGIFIAMNVDGAIDGVIITVNLGGVQVEVRPPKTESDVTAADLVIHAVLYWRTRGATLFQSLIREDQQERLTAMNQAGFRVVSALVFYERELIEADKTLPPLTLQLRDAPLNDVAFAALVARTYDGSADMPELNGLRSPEEILAGYQRSNKVDPPLWFYASVDGVDVGVIVMNITDPNEFELTYMGLVPEARSRGLGRGLGQIAVTLAAGFGGSVLALTADARNTSADRIYTQLGFRAVERRAVWLLI